MINEIANLYCAKGKTDGRWALIFGEKSVNLIEVEGTKFEILMVLQI